MKLIDYIESVEVPTNSISKLRFYFGEQPTLRDRRVMYIMIPETDHSKNPSGKTHINEIVEAKAYLVLTSKNSEVINRYPVQYFWQSHQGILPLLIDKIIDFPKSYIEIPNTVGLDATESFLFTFFCADFQKRPTIGSGLNVELVEVKTTPATIQKFLMPDNENLHRKVIHSIEYPTTDPSVTPSNGTRVTKTAENKSFLNMVSGGNDIIKNLPLDLIILTNSSGLKIDLNFSPDIPKSYVFVADTTDTVADSVFMFWFYYYDKIIRKK